jgi:hypothetical protein
MAIWIDVMGVARALRDKRDGGQPLDGEDADRLLTVLLDFHERAVVSTPQTERPAAHKPSS